MANLTLDHWFYPWFGSHGQSTALVVSRADIVTTRGRGHIRFRIPRRLLEEQSGVKMELGKLYELSGQITGVCAFHTFRAGTEAETLLLHVPREHQKSVVPHQLYQIRFDSITQKELNPELAKLFERTGAGMNWALFARMVTP